jgi:O-antigen ligase
MKKNNSKNKYTPLFGLIFLSPIVYSTRLLEMDNLQKLTLFILAIPIFYYLNKGLEIKKEVAVDLSILFFLILFPLTFLTSFVNGSSEMLPLQLTYLLPPVFILTFIVFVFNQIGEEKFLKISSFSIVVVSTLFSFIGLLQVMNVELMPLPQIIIPGSTIGHRGFAAEFLLPAIPFLLILKNYVKKDYYPLLFFAGVINISFLLFTRSRSALGISILIITAIIVRIIFQKNFKYKIQTLIPIIGVYLVGFLLSLIPPIKGERSDFGTNVKSIVDTEYKSNKLRMNFWHASLEMIKENTLTGVGLQKWSGVYPKYYGDEFVDSKIYIVHAVHSHNDFLELFAENGFATPIIYSIILLMIIYNLYKKSKFNENYFFILLSALSTVGFSFIAFPMSKFSSYFFLAFASGLAIISVKEEGRIVHISFNKIKWILAILIVFGIITSYIRLSSELSYVKAIEYKNGKDYNSLVKELENVNSVLYPFDASKQPIEYYRAIGFYRLGKLDEAMTHSIKSEKAAPYNPLVLHNTAAIYQSSKKYDNAIIYYEQMHKIFPNYLSSQINLLGIYSETEQFEKGKQLFNELIKKDALNPRIISFKSKYSN